MVIFTWSVRIYRRVLRIFISPKILLLNSSRLNLFFAAISSNFTEFSYFKCYFYHWKKILVTFMVPAPNEYFWKLNFMFLVTKERKWCFYWSVLSNIFSSNTVICDKKKFDRKNYVCYIISPSFQGFLI